MKNFLKNSSGFSLIEIIIVMTILTVFSTMATKSIKTAMDNKKKIDAHLRLQSSVFDTLTIIKSDLEKAFHYTHPFYELDKAAIAASQQSTTNKNSGTGGAGAATAPVPFAPTTPAVQPLPVPTKLTQFLGKSQSMHFTTLNHRRSVANSQESHQVEVGYFLKDCYARGGKRKKRSSCLWRRESVMIDDQVDDGGKSVVLLEHVTDFKLEYLSENPQNKDWREDWRSDRNGNADTLNQFPKLVKVVIAIEDPKKVITGFRQTVIAAIRYTNNRDPKELFNTTSTAGGATNTNGGSAQPQPTGF